MRRRTLQEANPPIVATQSREPGHGRLSKERKHLLPSYSPITEFLYKIVSQEQYTIPLTEMKGHFGAIFPLRPKTHFFLPLIYIFVIFFALNKEKKWESGQKTRKALCRNGFRLPTFQKFLGKNPLFLGFFVRTRFTNLPIFHKKWAKACFPISKVGRNLANFCKRVRTIFHTRKVFPVLFSMRETCPFS